MDEESSYDSLSKMDDECGQGSTCSTRFMDDANLRMLIMTDGHSTSGEGIFGWETNFTSLETVNGSIDNKLSNGLSFGCDCNLESNDSAAAGRWEDELESDLSDWKDKSSEFEFRKCRDSYMISLLKDQTQLLLNTLEDSTNNGKKLFNCDSAESEVEKLEKKVKDLLEKNLRLSFMRDLLLERSLKPSADAKYRHLQDRLRYANSIYKLATQKKNLLEEDLRRNKRQNQFIQNRLCDIEQENYRLKKENSQFKLLIQSLINGNKTCKYHGDKSTKDCKDRRSSEFYNCTHCEVLKCLREKGYILRSDGVLLKANVENAGDVKVKGFEHFDFIEDDDLEVDGPSDVKFNPKDDSPDADLNF